MNHKKKRETSARKNRGTQQITLRWKYTFSNRKPASNEITQWDEISTYFGDTKDKGMTFGQFRDYLIRTGIEKNGYEFVGEIRGSQIHVPLKYSGLHKVSHTTNPFGDTSGFVLVLWNPETDKVELWKLNNEFQGKVIEYMSKCYTLNAIVEDESNGQLTPRELIRLRTLRNLHLPTDEQKKPVELVEREVHPEFTPQEASEEGYETFRDTGRAPIPVPTREELDAITRTVEIAARNDEGNVIPTAEYFALNPLSPLEITQERAKESDNYALASVIGAAILDERNDERDINLMLQAIVNSTHSPDYEIETIIQQGKKFDFDKVRRYLMTPEIADNPENKAFAEDILGRLMVEQDSLVDGSDSLFERVHLLSSEMNDIDLLLTKPVAMCGEHVVGKFVGLDQYKYAGAPPYTPICRKCIGQIPTDISEKDLTSDDPEASDIEEERSNQGNRNVIAEEIAEYGEHRKFEEWVRHEIMNENPKAANFWYHNQMVLALFNYGTQKRPEGNRPVVHYLLCEWEQKRILKQGSDYFPAASMWDEPTGARAAYDLLDFWEGGEVDPDYEWRQNLLWRDQYGDPVPRDIIALPFFTMLDTHDAIMKATWYKLETSERIGYIFVSAGEAGITEDDWLTPSDFNFENYPITGRIFKIDDPLKRYNMTEGYYTA